MVKYISKKNFVGIVCVLCILLFAVYMDYIFGDKYLVSLKTASDSYGQFYPMILNQARILSEYGFVSVIDFTIGLGASLSTFDFFSLNNFASFFGEEYVLYMFGIRHIIFVFLAGLFFYRYILLLTGKNYIATITALFYAFCGPILVRQLWIGYINEYLLFAAWLWSYEALLKKRDIRFFTFFSILMLINFDTYTTILYCIVISGYVFFRLFWDNEFYELKLRNILAIPVMPLLMILIKFNGLHRFIENVRVATNTNRFQVATSGQRIFESAFSKQNGLFWLEKKELLTLYVRTIGTNTPVRAGAYNGVMNYLEDPAFYCGILVLILILPIWFSFSKRKKLLSFLVFFLAFVYIFFNPVRIVSNGFVKDTFKLSAFWIVVFCLFVFSVGLDDFLHQNNRRNIYIITMECICMEMINVYCLIKTDNDRSNIILATVFTLFYYIVFFFLIQVRCDVRKVIIILSVLTIAEVFLQGLICVGHIETIDKNIVNEKRLHNDSTIEALEYIHNREQIEAYRIDKQFVSYNSCDSTAQNYYSYPYYIGGQGIDSGIVNFYEIYDMPSSNAAYNYTYGSGINNYFDEIIGTKYILSKEERIANLGYRPISKIGEIWIYENQYPVSWLYVQNQYIKQEEFEKLTWYDRGRVILNAVVLSDELANKSECKEFDLTVDGNKADYDEYEVGVTKSKNGDYSLTAGNDIDSITLIKAKYLGNDELYSKRLEYQCEDIKKIYYINLKPQEEYTYEINSNVNNFSFMDNNGEKNLENIEVRAYLIPRMIYENDYLKSVAQVRNKGAQIVEFDNLGLTAKINVAKEGILCTSIPYGNVEIFIDGASSNVYCINYGMVGCDISAGEHEVKLVYGKKFGVIDILKNNVPLLLSFVVMIVFSFISPVGEERLKRESQIL